MCGWQCSPEPTKHPSRWWERPLSSNGHQNPLQRKQQQNSKYRGRGRTVACSMGGQGGEAHWRHTSTNNLLVTATHKKLPKALLKLVGLKHMTWKQFTDAVREVTLEELMEKIEEERDTATRYAPAIPNTPSKALGAAFQNIALTQQPQLNQTSQYPTPCALFNTYSERPAHKRLADILSKALPLQPNNAEGLATYNKQIATWQATHSQGGKGPTDMALSANPRHGTSRVRRMLEIWKQSPPPSSMPSITSTYSWK